MRSPIQEASSLCEFHWLFSDELPTESLPMFIPRVLNFGQSSTQSTQGSPYQPRPRFSRYEQEGSPVFNPKSCPPYYSNEDEPTPGHSSNSNVSLGLLKPSEAHGLSLGSGHRHKRQTETSVEDDDHTRKYVRVSVTRPTNVFESNNSDASADCTPPSTASPPFQFSGPLSGPNYSSFDHLLEIQSLRAQLAISESRNAQAMVEIADSRICIEFLLDEVRRLIGSGGPDHQIPEKVRRIMRNTVNGVQLSTRALPGVTHLPASSSSHQAPSPVLPDTAWNEDLDPRNPYSYYFSEHSMVGPSTQLEPAPTVLPISSQLGAFGSVQRLESISPFGTEESTSHAELSRVASEDYVPSRPMSSLAQPRRNYQPNGSQLVPDWSHTRFDSYFSLYSSEPTPSVDTYQEERHNAHFQHYQLPSNIGN